MKIYLVGGAVRDRMLGLPTRESDWVVVGATAQQMLAAGYKQVGKDFPVFLHPETGEEYALARTERKTAPGYHGFVVHADPDVALEDDLLRRDLTINAMAMEESGTVIDPFGGRADIKKRLLRHTSEAFVEDPVRVLRVARFAARFAPIGFQIAPETRLLMERMVRDGEVDALVPERVWQETDRALGELAPDVYFEVLREVGALAILFPEVEALFGVPQPEDWHPEIDTGVHTLMVLRAAAELTRCRSVRFAALVHDLGKATTPREEWPSHRGHERRSVQLIRSLAKRLRLPKKYTDLAVLVARYHGHCHRALELRPATLLKLFQSLDAFRRRDRFEDFLLACEADARGRKDKGNDPYPQAEFLRKVHAAALSPGIEDIDASRDNGTDIAKQLREARIAAIREVVRGVGDK